MDSRAEQSRERERGPHSEFVQTKIENVSLRPPKSNLDSDVHAHD